MANITKVEDSATISTTEYDLVRDASYSSGSLTAGPAYVVLELDADALLITDTFTVRLRTDVNGDVATVSEWVLQGPYTDHVRIDLGLVADYAITIIRTTGADQAIGWKLLTDGGAPTVAENQSGMATSTAVSAVQALVAALPSAAVTAAAVLASTVEGSITVARWMRGMWAFGLTKASGFAASPVVLRDAADTKNRISIAHDATGRTSVTLTDLD